MPCVSPLLRRFTFATLIVVLTTSIAGAAELKTDQAHWQKGEVRWFSQWVPFDKVPARRSALQHRMVRADSGQL